MTDDRPQPASGAEAPERRGTPPGAGIVAPAHGGRIGNPPFVPTEDQRRQVRALAQVFPPAAQRYIAVKMGISETTLKKHFRDDLDIGRADMLATVGAQFINAAIDANNPLSKGDRDAQKFILARLAGWSNKVELSGKDGGPVETVDLSRLSDKELAEYGRISAIAAGLDPDVIVAIPIADG
jgi:hypothetical protein